MGKAMESSNRKARTDISPREALALLQAGNERFAANRTTNHDFSQQVRATAQLQQPFAVVLSCIDSRTSSELIFDQGLGDVFSVRVAGNVLSEDVLGSLEFACKLAKAKIVVVLGHSRCGAIQGACEGARLGHLSGLLEKIQPAVDFVRQADQLDGDELYFRVAKKNVENVARSIRASSSVLAALVEEGQLDIVEAMYSVQTGIVQFYE